MVHSLKLKIYLFLEAPDFKRGIINYLALCCTCSLDVYENYENLVTAAATFVAAKCFVIHRLPFQAVMEPSYAFHQRRNSPSFAPPYHLKHSE